MKRPYRTMTRILAVATLGLASSMLSAQLQPTANRPGTAKNTSAARTAQRPVPFSTTLQWILRRELVAALSSNVKPLPKLLPRRGPTSPIAPALQPAAALKLPLRTPNLPANQTLLSHGTGGQTAPALGPSANRSPAQLSPGSVSHLCAPGISGVSGKTTGVTFTPAGGPYGIYVIQGCGFGSQAGQVYIANLRYPRNEKAGPTKGPAIQVRLNPDQLPLSVAPNGWSDQQIITHIDPNAGGYYDTDSVTVVVKTSTGQEYKAGAGTPNPAKYSFQATRVAQLLYLTDGSPYNLDFDYEYDSTGKYPSIYVGSSASSVFPGMHSIVVVRQDVGASFSPGYGRYDHFNLVPAVPNYPEYVDAELMDGFEVSGVQLYTAGLPSHACVYIPPGSAQVTTSGNWDIHTPGDGYDIFWQVQTCTTTSAHSGSQVESVSAYALDITVVGPRGVPPWRFMSGY